MGYFYQNRSGKKTNIKRFIPTMMSGCDVCIWKVMKVSSPAVRVLREDNTLAEVYFMFDTLRPRQNGLHFPDDILKLIFLNENAWIAIEILLQFVPRGPIKIFKHWCR